MPEGDTIFRAARVLRATLTGRPVTDVSTTVPQVTQLAPRRLVGQRVADVEPRGKHLLMWFDPGDLALHTHMGMSGSWHTYAPGQGWRRPQRSARIVLTFPEIVAVCFSAPVVALLTRDQIARHPTLSALGPDALAPDTDLAAARRRLDERASWTIGEALLDQGVLAGVGNIYKNEVCFIHGVDPWARVDACDDATRDALLATCGRLLKANAVRPSAGRVTTGAQAGRSRLHVYGRARRPCLRCGTPIRVARQGALGRLTYWCPRCQGPGAAPAGSR